MPSGAHGSSGSHHSSGSGFGGGGFGGSHFGGSSSHSSSSRPIRVHFGPRVFVVPAEKRGRVSSFVFFTMFALFIGLVGVIIFNSSKQEVKNIETDFANYQYMINYALDQDPNPDTNDYIVTAEAKTKFYNDAADKWFIKYYIKELDSLGASFSVYSLDEANQIMSNRYIHVVLEVPLSEADELTDSIPLDFKDMKLEDDGEYVNALNSINTGRWVMILGFGLAGVLLVCSILVFKKSLTEEKEVKQTASPETNTTLKKEEQNTTCEYCGARHSKDATKCPSCGARIK